VKVPVPDELLPADRLGRVHFVGIGGAALSAIARLMLARGIAVTGSDAQDAPVLDALRVLGARCFVGHDAAQVGEADTVVVSTAVRADNPEVVEAERRGLRLLPRSAALESVMQGHRVLAVAGTHGKTTTTSLLTMALLATGVDPTYAVGGDLADTGTNAAQGRGDLFVAEADESDGAFLVYSPYAAAVTTVDADHLDVWGTEAAYRAAFERFVTRIDPAGFLVVNADDEGAAALAGTARRRGLEVVTVSAGAAGAVGSAGSAGSLGPTGSTARAADLRLDAITLDGGGTRADVTWSGRPAGELRLSVPGRHYALDAALALATGLRLGLGFDDLTRGLAGFSGTRRRMEAKGTAAGVRVYDSYAHHPVEIAGDLDAARALAGDGRLIVCFQPHLVSRTRVFGAAMGQALGAADEVVVLDIYLAREESEPGVDAGLVAAAVPLPVGRVHVGHDLASAPVVLAGLARPGDLVLTLGAGDVTTVGPRLLTELRGEGRDG
jgi:UDP-N-acetylmuramate--alanine ligase